MERLDKILAGTGWWSRKEVKEMVRTGRVVVNGTVVATADQKFDPQSTFVVDGEVVSGERLIYIMLHKPAGVISATEDATKETVLDLLPPHLKKVGLFPVGRLDRDTEGLLMLTNDGVLAHRLLSPRWHVDKTYFVQVDGVLDEGDVQAFVKGLELRDGLQCMPAKLEILNPPSEGLVTIQEGKYHQIKRMMATRYKPVNYLKRLSMGPLQLDKTLEKGEFRPLTTAELSALKEGEK